MLESAKRKTMSHTLADLMVRYEYDFDVWARRSGC